MVLFLSNTSWTKATLQNRNGHYNGFSYTNSMWRHHKHQSVHWGTLFLRLLWNMQLSSTLLFAEACSAAAKLKIKCFWRFRCQQFPKGSHRQGNIWKLLMVQDMFSALSTSPLRELGFNPMFFIVFVCFKNVVSWNRKKCWAVWHMRCSSCC